MLWQALARQRTSTAQSQKILKGVCSRKHPWQVKISKSLKNVRYFGLRSLLCADQKLKLNDTSRMEQIQNRKYPFHNLCSLEINSYADIKSRRNTHFQSRQEHKNTLLLHSEPQNLCLSVITLIKNKISLLLLFIFIKIVQPDLTRSKETQNLNSGVYTCIYICT